MDEPCDTAIVPAMPQRRIRLCAEYLYPLCEAAEAHIDAVVWPRLLAQADGSPKLTAFGFPVHPSGLWYYGDFLPVLLAVGADLLGQAPLPLKERYSSLFNHIPDEGAVFDPDAYDAGLSLAQPADGGVLVLDPAVTAYDRHLLRRGFRGAGIHLGPVCPSSVPTMELPSDDPWEPWWKLDRRHRQRMAWIAEIRQTKPQNSK